MGKLKLSKSFQIQKIAVTHQIPHLKRILKFQMKIIRLIPSSQKRIYLGIRNLPIKEFCQWGYEFKFH